MFEPKGLIGDDDFGIINEYEEHSIKNRSNLGKKSDSNLKE